jgi:hypothetical protein
MVLGVELNTTLTFTKHWREVKHATTFLINALSTSLLTQSRRIHAIRGALGKHFTLLLGLFNDRKLDTLEGPICRALRSAVSSVCNLPRIALHCRTCDLGYGLPSLNARA